MSVLLNSKLNSCRKPYALYANSASEKEKENAARICAGRLGGAGAKREEGLGEKGVREEGWHGKRMERTESQRQRGRRKEETREGGDGTREATRGGIEGTDGGLVSIRRQ